MEKPDTENAHIVNDAIRDLQHRQADHKAEAKKLQDAVKQLDREYRETLERVEKEHQARRGKLVQKRHAEERATVILERDIARERAAEAQRLREEAELNANIEMLKPALARIGLHAGGK